MGKKQGATIALALLLLLCAATPQPLRLHVIANSDSREDQELKLQVRDAVLCCVQGLEGADTASQTRQRLMEQGRTLQQKIEQVLREQGACYGAQLQMGWFDFPDKAYGDTTYPAGKYRALRVVLGDGAGQNWWCVMYPPLCIGQEPSEEGIKFHSAFAQWLKKIKARGTKKAAAGGII